MLVPIELSRKSARSGFFLKALDDEALVNPALVELLRRQHQVVLPELPELEESNGDGGFQTFLAGVRVCAAISALGVLGLAGFVLARFRSVGQPAGA